MSGGLQRLIKIFLIFISSIRRLFRGTFIWKKKCKKRLILFFETICASSSNCTFFGLLLGPLRGSSWRSSQYYFNTVWSSSYFSWGLSVCKWLLQITGRKWSHIFCCNSEYLLDSSIRVTSSAHNRNYTRNFSNLCCCCVQLAATTVL